MARRPAQGEPGTRLDKASRRDRIVAELRANAALRVSEIAARFGVTTETVRRDLDALAKDGLVNRTYGGAASAGNLLEPGFNRRYRQHVAERQRVAAAAAALVEPGDVLMIDAGSTTTHLARQLAVDGRELTVFTNSLGVATALAPNSGVRIVLCPGDYDTHEGGVCGSETHAFLRRFHATKCFIGASALTEQGVWDANTEAAWVKRIMLERSKRCLLVIDASKYGRRVLDRVCGLEALDDAVTDAPPPRSLARALAGHRVTLHVAPP